jgi:hypothetical protein
MKISKKVTARGFTYLQFKDSYDKLCTMQKSSLATDDAIWLGIDDADPKIMASQAASYGIKTEETCGWVPYPIPDAVLLNTRMHLTREQVKALLPALMHFVDTGDVEVKSRVSWKKSHMNPENT